MQKKLNYVTYGSLAFSLVYIFLEITFNLGLVDFVNSRNTEINVFQGLETLGRALSSIGFALFIVKLFLKPLKKLYSLLPYIVFVVSVCVFYLSETVIFDKIIDNMSNQQKFDSYSLGVYRNLVLNGQLESTLFNHENNHYDEVVNSMIVLINKNEVKEKINKDIQNFFKINYQVDAQSLGSIYDKIASVKSAGSENMHDFYKLYYIESKRYENYHGLFKNKYKENFVKTIGIEPSLSEEEFNSAFKERQAQKQTINWDNIVIIPENKQIKMNSLTLGEIPKNLNKTQWIDFINQHINTAIDKLKFNADNINNLPHVKNIISSVIITPIAIILSLLSIILNISLLFKGKIKVMILLSFAAIGGFYTYNPYDIHSVLNKLVGLESRMVASLNPYRVFIHKAFVNDTNPNTFNIVKIEKPEMPDMKEENDKAQKAFNDLIEKNNATESQVKKNDETYVDDKKMQQDNYYGELNKKNPYAK